MKPLTPYIFFNGNCREAMEFYQKCFGGELEIHTYADMPDDNECQGSKANADKDAVMHASLVSGDFKLMASDNPMSAPVVGDNVCISIEPESKQHTQKLFDALSEGGNATMPPADTFWGSHFGMLVDKYGFHWMLNFPLEQQ